MSFHFRIWRWSLVGALVYILLVAGSLHSTGIFTWTQAWLRPVSDILPWAVILPFVIQFCRRFPLTKDQLRVSIPIHLLTGSFLLFAIPVFSHWMLHLSGIDPVHFHPRGHGPPMPSPDSTSRDFPPLPPPDENGWRHYLFIPMQLHLPLYWLGLGGCEMWRYHQQAADRARQADELTILLSRSRAANLRMQLQPHFLFNALNALSTLVHSSPLQADEMIGSLSELLRRALHDSDRSEVSLREELEVMDLYLDIQKIRFGERLVIEQDIPTDLLDAAVPGLLLQPLVENSVKHALERRNHPLRIAVKATRENSNLILTVSDDGPGLANPNTALKEGIGIGNTRARLAVLYPDRHAFSAGNQTGGGFVATCLLPLRAVSSTNS
ncbi:MAG TPA: histidine kinase [Lacunisphaera sp.]